MNGNPSEYIAVVETIDPDAYTAASPTSSYNTGWIDMENWEALLAIVQTGILGTAALLDAKLEQASDSSGTGAKDITGKAITQLDEAGASPPAVNDSQYLINLRAEELDVEGGFTHVRLSTTLDAATSDYSAIVLGVGPRYGPANAFDLASVGEIIS